jgi:DNA-binding NarL/FixJ family response regulator
VISVLVADDQPLVRAGIVMLLSAQPDIQVLGEASNGREAVRLTHQLRPDVVLMDLRMPELDGTEATRQIVEESEHDHDGLAKVLVLTTFNEDETVYGALRAGASGFLLKYAAPDDLPTAVRLVASGGSYLDPEIAGHVIKALRELPHPSGDTVSSSDLVDLLTRREVEILGQVALGLSNGEISAKFVLSEATVKTHVSRILMKTGSRDRAQAVALAYLSGLVRPPRP